LWGKGSLKDEISDNCFLRLRNQAQGGIVEIPIQAQRRHVMLCSVMRCYAMAIPDDCFSLL
jgi:hypothetical protein